MAARQQGTTQFAVVPEWVLFGVSANAVKLYAVLDRHRNGETEQCNPSLKRLSALMDVSEATVRRAMRELEDAGAVLREQGWRTDGSKGSNDYRLARDPELQGHLAHVQGAPSISARRAPSTRARTLNETKLERSTKLATLASFEDAALVPYEPPVPKLTKIDGQNLGFNALCEACGIDPKGNQSGRVVAALNGNKAIKIGIRTLVWRELVAALEGGEVLTSEVAGETFERHVAARIIAQADLYEKAMPGAALTPTSLATWWTDLKVQPRKYSAAEHLRLLRGGGE